ncbi:MAG: response regulator [Cyanobacteria bacterium SBLK]|nr:response regulator [Cyanobacteria bacterium SBLK]
MKGKECRILVIEDSPEVRHTTQQILELAGYQVLTAENGRIGLDLALEHLPDLILCDVAMPEMDGYDVLSQLQLHPETQDTPFIFLTAKAERRDVGTGMLLGADDYITKPFSSQELIKSVRTRLDCRAFNVESD